jgi:hypothetical protein
VPRPYQDKNFRLLFAANLFSGVGQGMTVIGAPWYLSHRFPSSHVLGTVMIITTAVNLLFGPYAGALIDRHRRITLLRIENIAGMVVLGMMALWGLAGDYSLIGVAGIYVFTVMIFNLHFPATYALSQEAFPREWYGEISGMLEVITQTAAIVAGGLTGIMLDALGLPVVFAVDSLTYGIALLLFMRFHYVPRVGLVTVRPHFLAEMHVALQYLRKRPRFMYTNIALYLPFVVLISLDMIHPFYVAQELHAQAGVFSLFEGFYAVGATAAGLWMRRVALRVGDATAYGVAFALFIAALLTLAGFAHIPLALGVMIAVGWSNAGIRVNRIAFVMHTVPTELIGRVNTFFNWLGLWARGLLLLYLTWSIDTIGSRWSYASGAVILVVAFVLYRLQAGKSGNEDDIGGARPIP